MADAARCRCRSGTLSANFDQGWAPNGISIIITLCRPPSSCKNHTWTALLGNRAVSFQIPLPRLFWLHPAMLDACISTRRGRAQETDRPRSSYGTFMAHKSEKPWSAGSASVKQPGTKMADRERSVRVSVALIIRRSRVQAPAAPLSQFLCNRGQFETLAPPQASHVLRLVSTQSAAANNARATDRA